MKKQTRYFILLTAFLVSIIFPAGRVKAQAAIIRPILFPVIGKVSYSDDFNLNESNGIRIHHGNDLLGKKMMPLVAATDGVISYVNYPEATWGYSMGIRDSEGYEYQYLHVNNDNPGTDDGKGGGFFAYAPDVVRGNRVVKGQLLGCMGDSGNAESTSPHLHFEIHDPTGQAFDPYPSLKAANQIAAPVTDYPVQKDEIVPYGFFTGGASVAVGKEIVTGAGPGGGPLVKIFKADGSLQGTFYAYASNFTGGIDVAVADVDGDGTDEIITAPGKGGGPHIRIFKLDGTEVKGFYAYAPNFDGGVTVSAADLDGDGKAEIITGPGRGGGPDVRVFKADGTKVGEFMAYDPKASMGIDVSAAPKVGGNDAVIVTSPQSGGGPDIRIFTGSGNKLAEFMAYDSKFTGGVKVSAAAGKLVTVPGSIGGPHVRQFDYSGAVLKEDLAGFEDWWNGGYDIAMNGNSTYISSGFTPNFSAGLPGSRRASVRRIFD